MHVFASEDRPLLLCLCIVGVRVPPDRRGAAVEYLNRANFGLRSGNFELDFDDAV